MKNLVLIVFAFIALSTVYSNPSEEETFDMIEDIPKNGLEGQLIKNDDEDEDMEDSRRYRVCFRHCYYVKRFWRKVKVCRRTPVCYYISHHTWSKILSGRYTFPH